MKEETTTSGLKKNKGGCGVGSTQLWASTQWKGNAVNSKFQLTPSLSLKSETLDASKDGEREAGPVDVCANSGSALCPAAAEPG